MCRYRYVEAGSDSQPVVAQLERKYSIISIIVQVDTTPCVQYVIMHDYVLMAEIDCGSSTKVLNAQDFNKVASNYLVTSYKIHPGSYVQQMEINSKYYK